MRFSSKKIDSRDVESCHVTILTVLNQSNKMCEIYWFIFL